MNRYAGSAVVALAFWAGTGLAEPDLGAYLAAKQAGTSYDFVVAADYYQRALEADPANAALADNSVTALVALGRFDEAAVIARAMVEAGFSTQGAVLALIVADARAGDWADIDALLAAGHSVGPFVDGLARAWALVGLGQVQDAIAAFDAVGQSPGLLPFGLFNKALALASVGDFEGAEAILSMSEADGMQITRLSTIARAQVLSQLSRNPEAVDLIDMAFGPEPDEDIARLRYRLAAGEPVPFDAVEGPLAALGEAFFALALALDHEAEDSLTLIYARAAIALDASNTQALLLTANLLDRLSRYDLAVETYAAVPPEAPEFVLAEIGRADVLRRTDRAADAVSVLEDLERRYPEVPDVASALGDAYRALSRWQEATAAYARAIAASMPSDRQTWRLYYARGVAYERQGHWTEAEADFRQALTMSPDHPQILNYLGYSLVERRERLDEALTMIRRAVDGQPDNGAIVDSLAWAYFRLGRYAEAVAPMERAAEILPVDPVINDHLGDIFWAVGRFDEARFQWRRALSFGPEEAEAIRIRRKLEVGLDAVLQEEGAPPLHPANAAD